jgi:hypothetical protein
MTDSDPSSPTPFRYAGFISYSQKDKRWARRIHRALETYRLPTGIAADLPNLKRLGRFFRDDDELAGAPSLGEALESALDGSAALLVVCSPNAARSKWVDAEIERFKARGPSARVLAVIVDGQPDHPNPDVMCFAPSMLRKVGADGKLTDEPDEPLAPDVRKEPFNRLITRLVAGLTGLEFDTLWQREQRRIRRRKLIVGTVGLVALAGIAVGAAVYLQAEQARELAEQERQQAEVEQARAESINLAAAAQTAMDEDRPDDALRAAMQALPSNLNKPERPLTRTAVVALRRVLTANYADQVLARFDQSIDAMHHFETEQGKLLAVRLLDGHTRVLDAASGAERWRGAPDERLDWLVDPGLAATTTTDESQDADGTLKLAHRVNVRSLVDGKIHRSLAVTDNAWWLGPGAPMSPSGARVLVRASMSAPPEQRHQLAVWAVPETGGPAKAQSNGKGAGVIAQTQGPELTEGVLLRTAFSTENTVILNWGNAQRSVSLWDISGGSVTSLATPKTPFACADYTLDINPKRKDHVSVSMDRTLVAHARPAEGSGWCVSLWRATSGAALAPIFVEQTDVGGVDALSADAVAVARSARGWSANAAVWTRDGDELRVRGCKAPRVSFLDQDVVDQNRWWIDPDAGFSACAEGQQIFAYLGPAFADRNTLNGHAGKVRSLSFDSESMLLYSGADDGELRSWNFSRAPRLLANAGTALAMSAAFGSVAVTARATDDLFHAHVYTPHGKLLAGPLAYETDVPNDEDSRGRRMNLSTVLLAGGASVALIESWNCGFRGCPPEVPRRLTLYRVQDGVRLARIDGLRSGKFLAKVPIGHAFSEGRQRVALVRRDGLAIELDASTGEVLREVEIPNRRIVATAYTDNVMWLLADDGADKPDARRVSLFKSVDGAEFASVSEQQAQSGLLHQSAHAKGAIVEYSLAHVSGLPSRFQVLDVTNGARDLPLPDSHAKSSQSLKAVRFGQTMDRVALLFAKEGSAPLTYALDQASDVSVGVPLAASLPAGMSDPWRLHDPHARLSGSVDGEKLFLLTLTDADVPCADLVGRPADAARFSPNGELLAIADNSRGRLSVFDMQSCTRVFEAGIHVRHNGLMRFADDDSLWVMTGRGHVRIVLLAGNLRELHKRGRRLLGQ